MTPQHSERTPFSTKPLSIPPYSQCSLRLWSPSIPTRKLHRPRLPRLPAPGSRRSEISQSAGAARASRSARYARARGSTRTRWRPASGRWRAAGSSDRADTRMHRLGIAHGAAASDWRKLLPKRIWRTPRNPSRYASHDPRCGVLRKTARSIGSVGSSIWAARMTRPPMLNPTTLTRPPRRRISAASGAPSSSNGTTPRESYPNISAGPQYRMSLLEASADVAVGPRCRRGAA